MSPASKCPFHHLFSKDSSQKGLPDTSDRSGDVPSELQNSKQDASVYPHEEVSSDKQSTVSKEASRCPVLHSASVSKVEPAVLPGPASQNGSQANGIKPAAESRIGATSDLQSPSAAKPSQCPYGFGSSRSTLQSAIGPISCVVCTALLHDAVSCEPCGHIFCR